MSLPPRGQGLHHCIFSPPRPTAVSLLTETHHCVLPHGDPPHMYFSLSVTTATHLVMFPTEVSRSADQRRCLLGDEWNWGGSVRRPRLASHSGRPAPAPAPAQCRPVPPKAARCRPPAPPMAMRAEWFPVNGISARGKWSIGGAQSLKATAYMKLWTGYEVMDGRWAIRINKYVRLTCSMFAEILETRFRVGLAAGIFE